MADTNGNETGEKLAAQSLEFVATDLARKLQAVGQQLLDTPGLVEVSEGVFSTCQQPIKDLSDRLIRARDIGVPLVDVTLLRPGPFDGELEDLFGIKGSLIEGILLSDGIERELDTRDGNCLDFKRVRLSRRAIDVDLSPGGVEKIAAKIVLGRYFGYEGSSPSTEQQLSPNTMASHYYEHGNVTWPGAPKRIEACIEAAQPTLNQALIGEGVIGGPAGEPTPPQA